MALSSQIGGHRRLSVCGTTVLPILLGLALGLANTVVVFPTWAETVTPMSPLGDSLTGAAKEAYTDGKRIFDLKDYAGASIKFRVAYQLSNDFRLLKSIAACERPLLHYAEAYNLLAKYLKAGHGKLAADQVTAAEDSMVALKAFFSLVSVKADPDGASVLVDGVEVGKSPLAPFAVDLGNHKVRVESTGYEPSEQTILVPGKTEIPLIFDLKLLERKPGKLTINAGPTDTITIDGKTAAVGKYEGELKLGSHTIRVTNVGKKPYESIVELAAGSTRTVDVTLVTDSSGVPTWLWITGGVVVASGLTVGSYFLFKPKEESGTRLVGELETVSLKLFRGLRF